MKKEEKQKLIDIAKNSSCFEELKYIAVDSDGDVYGYSEKPHKSKDEGCWWVDTGSRSFLLGALDISDWEHSLVCLIDKDEEEKEYNRVEHPSYYNNTLPVEVIEICKHYNFTLGNVPKYVLRAGLKTEQGMSIQDKKIEDLKKARWYLDYEIKTLEENKKTTK